MKKISKSHHGTLNELNITPLLDLAFVLLVIFIITTPQLVNNLEMFLPSANQAKPANPDDPKPELTRIVVNSEGVISLDGASVTLAALTERLTVLKSANPEFGIVVKGSDEADYQHVINVLDIVQSLDITKVGLATDEVTP